MTAARSRTFRMFPPAGHPTFTTQRGTVLDATTNGYVDAVTQDADALQAAGWSRVIEIGPTASRPVPGNASDIPGHIVVLPPGYAYFDTELTQTVFWSPKKIWVDQTHTAV
jgi:hypothetical protein